MSGHLNHSSSGVGELLLAVATTESQREILNSIAFDPTASLAFNESITLNLKGPLKPAILQDAFKKVIERHSIFHSNFSSDGKYLMVNKVPQVFFEATKVSGPDEVRSVEAAEARSLFDLTNGALIKARLLTHTNGEEADLVLNAHHLVCDGWSWSVLVQDLVEIYNALDERKLPVLDGPMQYWEYAREVRAQTELAAKSLDYWRRTYQSLPQNIDFPFSRQRPAERSFHSKRIDYEFDSTLVRELKGQARQLGVSFYNFLYGAFALYLSKVCRVHDFSVGISAAPQSALGLKNLAGHCVNLLPVRHVIDEELLVRDFFKRSQRDFLTALDHQFCTFGEILRVLVLERDISRIPLCSVIFNVDQQAPNQGLNFKTLKAKMKTNPRVSENFEMFLNATLCGDKLTLENQFNTDLYRDSDILAFMGGLESFYRSLLGASEKKIAELEVKELGKEVTSPCVTLAETVLDNVKPATEETLEALRVIWAALLGHTNFDKTSNFFSLGGHSLLASEMMIKINQRFCIKIALKEIFKAKNLGELGQAVESVLSTESTQSEGKTSWPELKDLQEFELSSQQKQAWYVQKLGVETSVYNLPSFYLYKGGIDPELLAHAYTLFIKRHALTRAILIGEEHAPRVKVRELTVSQIRSEMIKVSKSDLTFDELKADAAKRTQRSLKLDAANFFNVEITQLGNGDVVTYILLHHMIWDGWCYDILRDELEQLYLGLDKLFKDRPQIELNERMHEVILGDSPKLSYAQYVDYQQQFAKSSTYSAQLAFWRQKLGADSELPILDLPTDFSRPKALSFRGDGVHLSWEEEEIVALEEVARSLGTTLYNLFLCAYKIFLMRYTNEERIIVGTPFRGRTIDGLSKTIGFFVNNLAVSTELCREESLSANLARVVESSTDAFNNADVGFDDIVRALKIKRSLSHTPIYQTFFVYQDATNRRVGFAGSEFDSHALVRGSLHTELDFWVRRDPKGMKGGLDFQTDLFKKETILRMSADFKELLRSIVSEGPQTPISKLNLIAPENRELLIHKLNHTACDFPTLSLHQLIEATIDRVGANRTAITSIDGELSYAELEERANKLAHHLIDSGVKPGDLLGICQSRSCALVVSLLAIMKAGAGYVPLDPNYPADRLRYMCEQSKLSAIVTTKDDGELDFFGQYEKILVDEDESWWKNASSVRPEIECNPAHTCYVIYTSGSTGLPKGVVLSHRAVVNFLSAMKKRPGLKESDTLCAVTTLSFDIAVLELYLPLVTGAKLVVATREEALLSDQLSELIESRQVSVMQATPATWRLLLASGHQLKAPFKVLCGGEPFPKDLAEALLQSGAEVWNMYGPTEATVWMTCKELSLQDLSISIGRPIDNSEVYILDSNRELVPYGAIGELYIGGICLADGYLGRDDLTRERFVPSPFKKGEFIYEAGDLARYRPNGDIDCLGRNDTQVKVRGHRIELGEIEAQLAKFPGVTKQVVIIREDRPGDVRIVAYYVSASKVPEGEMKAVLGKSLPQYMIPNHLIHMSDFPLTPSGKIDRKSLPRPDQGSERSVDTGPSTALESRFSDLVGTEAKLAMIWGRVLGVEVQDRESDFFELGGHSLQSVEVFSLIQKEFGVNLALSALFEASSLRALAALIDSWSTPAPAPFECEEEKLIVTMRDQRSHGAVVIFLHGVGGNILNYRSLLKFIPVWHDVFGIQAPGVSGENPFKGSLSDLAIFYAAHIKSTFAGKKFILAGGSMGGLLALEVAKVLLEDGLEVEKLIMFDTFGPSYDLKKFKSKKVSFFAKVKTALYYRSKRTINWFKVKLANIRGRPIPHSVRHFNVEMTNYRMMWTHKQEIYPGDIHLIRSALEESGWYADPKLGWEGTIKGDIHCHFVEGAEHANFVESMRAARAFEKILANK